MDEARVKKALENVRFLVADTGSSRRGIQQLLNHFEVQRSKIDMATTFVEAKELIFSNPPQVIFADFDLEGGSGLGLQRFQEAALERGVTPVFALIVNGGNGGNGGSNMLVATAADDPVDALLIRPFTLQSLKSQLIEIVERKLSPTEYFRLVNAGTQLLAGNAPENEDGKLSPEAALERAAEYLEQAAKLDPRMPQAFSYLGVLRHRQGSYPEAIRAYQQALAAKGDDFRSLLGLFDSHLSVGDHRNSYEIAKKIAHHHSLPLKRLPDFIKVAISNQSYQDVLSLYETSTELSQLAPEIGQSVAAGLVVCGLHFIREGDRPSTTNAFKKAYIASRGHELILKRILCALLGAGYLELYSEYAAKSSAELLASIEVRLAEIRHWHSHGDLFRALKLGLESINAGVHDAELFQLMIETSIEVKRSPGVIRELVDMGSYKYPEKAESFEALLRNAKL